MVASLHKRLHKCLLNTWKSETLPLSDPCEEISLETLFNDLFDNLRGLKSIVALLTARGWMLGSPCALRGSFVHSFPLNCSESVGCEISL